jgi:hypothetical protein
VALFSSGDALLMTISPGTKVIPSGAHMSSPMETAHGKLIPLMAAAKKGEGAQGEITVGNNDRSVAARLQMLCGNWEICRYVNATLPGTLPEEMALKEER